MKKIMKMKIFMIFLVITTGLLITSDLFAQEPDLIKNARANNIDEVKKILASDKNFNLNQEYPVMNMPPLQIAMMHNNTEMAKLFIDAGADVNYINYLGTACINKQVEMVKLLIAEGADLYKEREDYGIVYTPLGHALSNVEIAKILIDAGADINYQDTKNGMTPLMIAAISNYVESAKLLISEGTELDIQDKTRGYTALLFACERKFIDMANLLISNGANVNLKARDGKTALSISTEYEYTNIIEILKAAGAK